MTWRSRTRPSSGFRLTHLPAKVHISQKPIRDFADETVSPLSPHDIEVGFVTLDDASQFIDLEPLEAPPGVRLHIRVAPWSGGTLATVTLLELRRAR